MGEEKGGARAAAPLTTASRPQCSGTSCRGGTTPTPRSPPPKSRRRTPPPPPPPPAGSAAAPLSAASAVAWGPAPAGAAAAPPTAGPSIRRWTGGGGTGGPAGSTPPEVGLEPGGDALRGWLPLAPSLLRCGGTGLVLAEKRCRCKGGGPFGVPSLLVSGVRACTGEKKEARVFCGVLWFVRKLTVILSGAFLSLRFLFHVT